MRIRERRCSGFHCDQDAPDRKTRQASRLLSVNDEPEISISRIISAVPDLRVVTSIDLSNNGIGYELLGSVVVDVIPQIMNLRTLDIKNNELGSSGARELFEALHLNGHDVRYLDVSSNSIGDAAMASLSTLLSCNSLEVLCLAHNDVGPDGATLMAGGLTANTSLTELAIGYNSMGDSGAAKLAPIVARHPRLGMLDLSSNRIGSSGARALAEGLLAAPESCLAHLNLSCNCISDDGLRFISDSLQSFSSVVRLNLSENTLVTGEGRLDFTSSAAKWRSIEYLDLSSFNLTEGDTRNLARAIASPKCSLKEVMLFNNGLITTTAVNSIRNAVEMKERMCTEGTSSFNSLVMNSSVYAGMSITLLAAAVAVLGLCTRWDRLRIMEELPFIGRR